MVSFLLFAIFPMILGGILFALFIFFLKREGAKPPSPEIRKITPAEFIDEVARHSNLNNAEAKKIIEFVFSYFPEFNWRKKLPELKNGKMCQGNDQEHMKQS